MVASKKRPNTFILTGEALDDFYGTVVGTIINNNNFEIGIILGENAVECLFEIPLPVETTNCDGDQRQIHSICHCLSICFQDSSCSRNPDIHPTLSSNAASYLGCAD